MNWLTTRAAELSSFEGLFDTGTEISGSSLRRVAASTLFAELAAVDVSVDFSTGTPALDAYLLIEPLESADARSAAAIELTDATVDDAARFTTIGISVDSAFMTYLPDNEATEDELDLFSGPADGDVYIYRMNASTTPDHAAVFAASVITATSCGFGPCPEWKKDCGGLGCRCTKLIGVADRIRDRIYNLRRSAGTDVTVIELSCRPA